jgi:hypothetical protein
MRSYSVANTTHSVSVDPAAQKLLDFIRKMVEDKRQSAYSGCISIRVSFKDGGIRSCEQEIKNIVCFD